MPNMQKGPKVGQGQYPAPWSYEVHELSEGLSAIVYDANGTAIADHLDEATAAKIAAAPELLEALEQIDGLRMLLVAKHKLGDDATLMKMKEVIAAAVLKATGGAQ